MGLTRNADLFRTLLGRGVGLVFCDLPHVPPGLNNAASWPRAVASGKTTAVRLLARLRRGRSGRDEDEQLSVVRFALKSRGQCNVR